MTSKKADYFEAIGSDAFPRSGDPWPSPTASAEDVPFFLPSVVTENRSACDQQVTTITPPPQGVQKEPSVTTMVNDAEAALAAALRNVLAAQDWIERAKRLLCKARERS